MSPGARDTSYKRPSAPRNQLWRMKPLCTSRVPPDRLINEPFSVTTSLPLKFTAPPWAIHSPML
ncbi:hypothetical protein D3C85_1778370 [compost metagenome]